MIGSGQVCFHLKAGRLTLHRVPGRAGRPGAGRNVCRNIWLSLGMLAICCFSSVCIMFAVEPDRMPHAAACSTPGPTELPAPRPSVPPSVTVSASATWRLRRLLVLARVAARCGIRERPCPKGQYPSYEVWRRLWGGSLTFAVVAVAGRL